MCGRQVTASVAGMPGKLLAAAAAVLPSLLLLSLEPADACLDPLPRSYWVYAWYRNRPRVPPGKKEPERVNCVYEVGREAGRREQCWGGLPGLGNLMLAWCWLGARGWGAPLAMPRKEGGHALPVVADMQASRPSWRQQNDGQPPRPPACPCSLPRWCNCRSSGWGWGRRRRRYREAFSRLG